MQAQADCAVAPRGLNQRMDKSGKSGERDTRTARLRAALRENLKRRKAQAKGRGAAPTPLTGDATPPLNSAGIAGDKPKG